MIQILAILLTLSLFINYVCTADLKEIIVDNWPSSPRCEHCCSSPEVQIVRDKITMLLNYLPKTHTTGRISYLCQKGQSWDVCLFAKGILTLNTHIYGYFCCNLKEKCPVCQSLLFKTISKGAIQQELATHPLPDFDKGAPFPVEAGVYELYGLTVTRHSDDSLELQLTANVKSEWDSRDQCTNCNGIHYLHTVTIGGQSYFLDDRGLEDMKMQCPEEAKS